MSSGTTIVSMVSAWMLWLPCALGKLSLFGHVCSGHRNPNVRMFWAWKNIFECKLTNVCFRPNSHRLAYNLTTSNALKWELLPRRTIAYWVP